MSCLPLRLGLEATGGLTGIELVGGTPAETDAALLSGEVELGLVSSASWARNRDGLWRVPGYGLASDGPAMSVLLAAREGRPLREARSVALTGESATAPLLAKILLERAYGAVPRYEVLPELSARVLAEHDAALLVGDAPLLAARLPAGSRILDLGAAWREYSGLPMVYAVWASWGDPAGYGFWADRVAVAVGWAERHPDEVVGEARLRGATAADDDLRSYFSALGYRVGLREGEGLKKYLVEGGLSSSDLYGRASA